MECVPCNERSGQEEGSAHGRGKVEGQKGSRTWSSEELGGARGSSGELGPLVNAPSSELGGARFFSKSPKLQKRSELGEARSFVGGLPGMCIALTILSLSRRSV